MNNLATALETVNHVVTSKYPALLFIVGTALGIGYTLSTLNAIDNRSKLIENVELPGIRQDIKGLRDGIDGIHLEVNTLNVRTARLEENVKELKEDMKELKEDMKELKEDMKELRTTMKDILFILAEKKKP